MYVQIEINWRLFHAWLLAMPVKRMMGLENPQRICVQYVLKLSILQAQRPRKVLLGSMSWAFFPATRKPSSLSMYCNSCVLRCCYSWLSPEITLPRFNFTPTAISIAPTINSPPQHILCVPCTHSAPRGEVGDSMAILCHLQKIWGTGFSLEVCSLTIHHLLRCHPDRHTDNCWGPSCRRNSDVLHAPVLQIHSCGYCMDPPP
jgi:hypothetical protein